MSAREIVEAAYDSPEYWYDRGDRLMGDLMALEKQLETEFPQLHDLDLANRSGSVFVNSIHVKPEFRGQGVGQKVLERIKRFAAEKGLPVLLSPEPDRGKKGALDRFYRNLGFRPNRGKRGDPQYTGAMIWRK